MQPMSRFDANTPTKLQALISDLRWRVQLLSADIQDEEKKAGICDPNNLSYPMLALTLRGRRDNLLATVATLEARLETVDRGTGWERAA